MAEGKKSLKDITMDMAAAASARFNLHAEAASLCFLLATEDMIDARSRDGKEPVE